MIQTPNTISCVAAMGSPLCQSCLVLSSYSAKAAPGFKSQSQSSSAAPCPTPPTLSYTSQHSLFFQLDWAAIVSLGRCGPMAWSQSSPSSDTGAVTRKSCLHLHPGLKSLPSPWLKARPQLFNITMKPVKGCRYGKRLF